MNNRRDLSCSSYIVFSTQHFWTMHVPDCKPSLQVVLSSLLGLQPSVAAGSGGMSKEEIVSVIATDLFEHVPPPFNLEAVMKAKADDPSALHVVLFQELERYNALLVRVRRSCSDLLKGIQGLVVMSAGANQPPSAPQVTCIPEWLSLVP